MIGREQETWPFETFTTSEASWNVIAQQIDMFDYSSGSEANIMGWDVHGYAHDRIMYFQDCARPIWSWCHLPSPVCTLRISSTMTYKDDLVARSSSSSYPPD
jgi:hypothetical protein